MVWKLLKETVSEVVERYEMESVERDSRRKEYGSTQFIDGYVAVPDPEW